MSETQENYGTEGTEYKNLKSVSDLQKELIASLEKEKKISELLMKTQKELIAALKENIGFWKEEALKNRLYAVNDPSKWLEEDSDEH